MSGLGVVIGREFTGRITKKGYWIFTVIGLIVMVGLTFMPTITKFINQQSRTQVVIDDPKQLIAAQVEHVIAQSPDAYPIAVKINDAKDVGQFDASAMKSYMKSNHTSTVIVVNGDSLAAARFDIEQNGTLDPQKLGAIEQLLQQQVTTARVNTLESSAAAALNAPVPVDVHQLQTGAKSNEQLMQSQMLVYFMELLLFATLVLYGTWVAQGVIEEKANRIVEMMLIAVKPWHILFGKVLGVGLVALVQYAVWTVAVVASLFLQHSRSQVDLSAVAPSTIVLFPVFFLLGYLFYSTLFGIGGSLVHRSEEQQMAVAPVSILMAVAFYASIAVFVNPDSTLSVVASFIPFCTPLSMFARVALGNVPVWQVGLSIVIMAASIWLLVRIGASVYRRFALHSAGKSGWKLLLRNKTAPSSKTNVG